MIAMPIHLSDYLSDEEKSWLTDSSSLSLRLRQFTKNKIIFQVLHDHWDNADEAAYQLLSIDHKMKTWIRRIEWCYENQLWIHATVVIPETSLTDQTRELMHVGNGAIGDILFQDPTLTRSHFTFQKNENIFSRDIIFHYKQHPLLITEIFFPEFFRAVCKKN